MKFHSPKHFLTTGTSALCAIAGMVAACSSNDAGSIKAGQTRQAAVLVLPVYAEVTPTVTPLSETSVQLTWTAPAGTIDHYDVFLSNSRGTDPDLTVAPYLANVANTATSAKLRNLAPGTLRRVVVAATLTGDAGVGAFAQSALVWTPFGAVNEDSVSSVTPLTGLTADLYAEASYVSSSFSMLFGHAYVPELSFVFNGPPPSPTARPVYNFASHLLKLGNGFSYPDVTDVNQIWSDGRRVLVSNNFQNRILVYNHLPTTAAKATPDLLLGQTSWTSTAVNNGAASTNAQGISQAAGSCFNGKTLYVRDDGNNRILGYTAWPTQMGQAANFVLGQPDLVSNKANNGGVSKASFNFGPDGGAGIDCSHGMLAVADPGNARVLIWKKPPTQSGVPADIVLGQSNGSTSNQAGAGGIAAGGFMLPSNAVFMDNASGGTAIVVADGKANRVVGWNTIPTTDGAPFDSVIGQPDRNTTTPNTGGKSLASLNDPLLLSVDDQNQLWVSDFKNCRFLVFPQGSTTATQVFGQRDGTSLEFEAGSYSPTRFGWTHWGRGQFGIDPANGFFTPGAGRFWNQAPPDGNTPLSAVQGQIDENRFAPATTSASTVAGGMGIVQVGTRVYYSDTNRILSIVGPFTSDNMNADVVLGNQDFNGTVVAPATLDYAINPTYLASDGTSLLAVDGARIVGWLPAPTTSNRPVSFALGQPSTLVNTPNNGGVTASTLGGGRNTLTVANGKLIVADPANNRVLIWNKMPSTSGAPADVVLGQSSFSTSAAGSGAAAMNAPSSVAVLNGKLVVSDTGNARLLVFAQIPTQSGVAPDYLWSPSSARFSLPSWFNGDELAPYDLGVYQGRLYVGQTGRILVLPDFFPGGSSSGGQTGGTPPLQVVTIAPPAAHLLASVDADGSGNTTATSNPSSPTPFTLPPTFEVGGEIGNGTATLTFTDTSGNTVTCTFQGQASSATPNTIADLEAGRILALKSCSDGLALGSQRTGSNFSWSMTPIPGWPVNIDLPLDDRSCAQTFQLLTGQQTRQMHDSFSWSKAQTVDETNPDGTPTLYYAWVYIRNNQDLLNVHKMFVHILPRPLFMKELEQFAGKCGTFSNPGDGIGQMIPVLMPGTVYNALVNVQTQGGVKGNKNIFDAVILRNKEVPAGVRNANGSVNLNALVQSGFGYLDYEPQPLPDQDHITLNGGAVAEAVEAITWVLDATKTVGRVITTAIGSIDRIFAGSVNFDIWIRSLNQPPSFNNLVPMTRGWGANAGKELGSANMRVTLLEALADGWLPETFSSTTDGDGHIAIKPAQHQSGFTRGSGICIELSNKAAHLSDWLQANEICDFKGLDVPPSKTYVDAAPTDNFVIPTFDWDQSFKLMISDPGLATLYEMDDVYTYDAQVIGKTISTAHVLTGDLAYFVAQRGTGRAFTPCIRLNNTNGEGALGAFLKTFTDGLTWPKYLDQDLKGNLASALLGGLSNNDIVMPYTQVYSQREVASHEYGHYTLCSYMQEQDSEAINLLIQSTLSLHGNSYWYATRYINEAFADFISGQVTGIANYGWVTNQKSPLNNVCAKPMLDAPVPCFDFNYNKVTPIGNDNSDDPLHDASIGRIASMIHDAFDGHPPADRNSANNPNDADPWMLDNHSPDGGVMSSSVYTYSPQGWGNFDGNKETVALSGPSIRSFLHALANDADTTDPGLLSTSPDGYLSDKSVYNALNDTMNGEGALWCRKCPVLELHSPTAPIPSGKKTVDDLSLRELLQACNGGDSTIHDILGSSPVDPTNLRIDGINCTPCGAHEYSDENGVCKPCVGTLIGNECVVCNPDVIIDAATTPMTGGVTSLPFKTTNAGPNQNCPGWFWLEIDNPSAVYSREAVAQIVSLNVDSPTTQQLCESQYSYTVAPFEDFGFVPGDPIPATGAYTPGVFPSECPITPTLEYDSASALPQVDGGPVKSIQIGIPSRSDLNVTWSTLTSGPNH